MFYNTNLRFILVILIACLFTPLLAQERLASPSEFLPQKHGEHFTPHHQLVDYFEYVASQRPNVILKEYGKTNENRPLICAVISSQKNIDNIESIRLNNLKRTGLEKGNISQDETAIVWMSFGVHGNEAGASESSIATLYALASGDDANVEKWLENTVVIIDPAVNPDGFSHYTHWNWKVGDALPNPKTEAQEHHEPWPGGRVNHYLFDLNRDWAWLTQVESQQRVKEYHQWMPHIHVDFHEQFHNNPYYFAPAAQPYHAYITEWQGDFQHVIGKNNAKYFDEQGWLYFTREIFDLLYPSYGDTYPTFNGAIGMTYEQGGHSMAGRAILLNNGDTLQLTDRIKHHKTTALSTVETASKNAATITAKFENYFQNSKQNPPGAYKTFIIKASSGEAKIKSLTSFLDAHDIEYGLAGTGKSNLRGFNYLNGKTESFKVEDNDLVISAHQPLSILTQVLFEPEPFVADSLTYDITAWALPYAYGLDAYALKEKMSPSKDFKSSTFQPNKSVKAYAYLLDWTSTEDAKVLKALQEKGVQVRVASLPLEISDRKFGRGSLIINKGDNRKLGNNFDSIIQEVTNNHQKEVFAVMTGWATSGNDLGSDKMKLLSNTNILILGGPSTNQNSFGHLWHFFDQELKIPVTNVDVERFNTLDLANYNVIVMTDGHYKSMSSGDLDRLIDWVKKGGKLIGMGSALRKLSSNSSITLKMKAKEFTTDTSVDKEPKHHHYGGQERSFIPGFIPGAIYRVNLDNTHPLAYGMSDFYYSLKTSGTAYNYLEKGWNVGYIGENPEVKGFVGYKLKQHLEETLVFGTQKIGKGKVVYLVDNPLFRGFWKQGKFLFANAVFLF